MMYRQMSVDSVSSTKNNEDTAEQGRRGGLDSLSLSTNRSRLRLCEFWPRDGAVDPPVTIAKSYPPPIFSAEAPDFDGVSVLQELPHVHPIQHDVLLPTLAHLQ